MKNGNLVTTIEIKDKQGRVVATKEVVTYAGLLNRAHQEGLKKVITRLVQAPSKDNGMTAICTATVTTGRGVFMDCGDANPENVRAGSVPHIIRVALTRAKARALRDAVNIGAIPLEEFGDYPPQSAKPQDDRPGMAETNRSNPTKNPKPATEAQKKRLFALAEKQDKSVDEAERYLCEQLGVRRLDNATVSGASALIQRLTRETSTTTKELVN